MTNTTHPLRHAASALAAVLAIASTQGLAQDQAAPFPAAPEPVIVVPDVPVPATPEPTVALPAEQPEATPPPSEAVVETPEAEPAPAPAPVAARTRAAAPGVRATTAQEPRAATATTPVADAAAPLPPVETAAPVAAEPALPIPASEPAPRIDRAMAGLVVLALAGLAILALAIWGFIAIGRRKPVRRYVAETTAPIRPAGPTIEHATVRHESGPIEPVAPAAQPARPVESLLASRQPATTGGLPHAGASVALPRELPESYEAREALFRRMVDARPDRANPFTDPRARMKRARLIMQSIGRDFGDADPWIDLSQYPNNWPELVDRRSAAA